MGKNAFLDPVTGVLKCWGYVESNEPGQIKMAVAEDFNLKPNEHKWDGVKFVPHVEPPAPPDPKEVAKTALKALDSKKATVEQVLDLLKLVL